MSTQNPTHGTKVDDSNAPNIEENAGAVAADSLAAESTRAGGGFNENRGSEPMDVKGASSTFANTNTSGAITLEPAADSVSRKIADEGPDDSYTSAVDGQSKATGKTEPTSHAGVAPTYVNSQGKYSGGPKGKNLTEGGFDSDDSKNASFTTDIGDENDPGRVAENKFANVNADVDGSAGTGPRQGGSGGGIYDALGDTSA